MVYQNFLEHHLDYIYFLYGTSFFVLALYCFLAAKSSYSRLSWRWLGLFAAIHGVSEILEIFLLSAGDSSAFAVIRYVVLASSYLCLMEFGRSGTEGSGGWRGGRLAMPLLFALSLAGSLWGMTGLNPTARYFLALPAGVWASAALVRASGSGVPGGGRLRPAGIAMGLYAVATGLVVPAMPFPPASIINYDTFVAAFGFNVQILRLALIIIITLSLTGFFRSSECEAAEAAAWRSPHCSYKPMALVFAFLAAGWIATEMVGRHVEDEARDNLMARTLTAAATIQPRHVAALSGTPADEGTPEFEHLRDDLIRIKAVNPDFRFVYLMGLRDGHEIFLVDAEPKDSPDYSRPGDVYPDATPEEIAAFKAGIPKVYEPYKDSWGTWVSGVAFIKDPRTGAAAAMLGMDIDAEKWLHQTALSRFFCMMITLALSAIVVAAYFAWRRSREAAEQHAALRLAEQKLANEKRLKDLVDSLGEGVIVQDAEGRIVFSSPEAERLLGWGPGEMTGERLSEALGYRGGETDGDAGSPGPGGTCPPVCADGARKSGESCFIRGDGSRLLVSYVSAPLLDGGEATGAVVAFQDITARKDMERQKEDFYAMVTHDLKSPLLVIQGFTDVLLDEKSGMLDEESVEMLGTVRDSGRKMLRMVGDFLTISRFESGRLTLAEAPGDIGDAAREAVDEVMPLAEKKGVKLGYCGAKDMPRIMFDKLQLQRAVSNLVNNAVHYTGPGGTVSVSVEHLAEDGAGYAVVSVSDTGAGIPPEEMGRVFDMYYRSSRTSGLRGSGIGLAIVKAVAAAHGGRVELDSEEGRGSTFKMFIPMKGLQT